ncbi:hypothetical protein HZH68_013561 [Vespula germanica]|uniref:Uncharacterized protein n=1 Tax=Vespula germanica TaxID=30212 RepID=A0A834JG21_VESGE|nr:hypothetical protein HZH68_013561 [Vespula germanica]
MRWKKKKESQYSNKTIKNRLEGGQFKVQITVNSYGFDVRIFEVGTLQEQDVDIVPVVVSAKSRGKDGKSS